MSEQVYNGGWVDWVEGPVKGATLTLPAWQGLVIVSFFTLYVQFSGACFWRVLCFVLHQIRSRTVARDGLYHQQQAILRNAVTAPNAMWSLTRSALAWKGKVKSPIAHSIPLLITTLIHIAFFGVAGLFSSQITDTTGGGLALVKSSTCGFPPEMVSPRNVESQSLTGDNLLLFNTEVLLGRQTLSKSQAYVRQCYNDNVNSGTATCNLYVTPHLVGVNSSADTNATCPFGSNACTNAAARYDSGFVYSDEDLGINARPRDSLSMRRVTTCAPITGEAYASNWTNNVPEILAGLSNTSAKFYEFGKSPGDQGCDATNVTTDTTTFCVTKYQKQNIQTPYTIRATTAYDDNKNASDFSPIQDFQVANSDVTLISILNQAKYAGNSTDPLFKALNETSTNSQFYTAANDLSFLGCTEQYQFCNRGNGRCTNLTGLYGMKESIDKGVLALSAKQQAIYTVMWKAAWAMSMQWAITILSDDILLARDWVFTAKSQSSSPLPPDQWILESYNLHNLSLAVFQRRVNEYASPENFEIKPGVSSLDKIIRQEDPNLAALCNLQKIRSTTHMSFSILGMVIILVVGSVLVLLDWFLVQYIFWFRAMTHRRLAKKEDWTQGGTLILHKQVLEARGIGPWNTQDWAFPTLTKRFLTFSPTEAESEASMPLDQGQGMSSDDQSTAYDRGKHTAMPQHSSVAETYSFSEDKTSH